jgi:hypothetical protein
MSVSLPFFALSVQVAAWQMPPVQTPEAQSPATVQALPSLQEAGQEPPQSVSVSVPFLTVSVQVGAWQSPF